MILQQVLVEATDFTDSKGNVIIARSANVSDELADKMAAWATVRTGLLPRQMTATYFTKLSKRYSLLGRSFAGGYDRHGDRALYSQLVLLKNANLRDYENNAVLVARLLNSSGAWMLSSSLPDKLPEIQLPDGGINSFAYSSQPVDAERILKSMDLHNRIGLTDADEPMAFMGAFLNSISLEQRANIGFSIGRRFSDSTPFQVSFYPGGDLNLEQQLIKNQIYPIRLRPSGERNYSDTSR